MAEKFYHQKIFEVDATIKTTLARKTIRYQALIAAFSEFRIDYEINFILFYFHDIFFNKSHGFN